MIQLHVGIDTLDLPSRFARAQKRILLHAAVYGPFAESEPHKDGLLAALNSSSFERLDIITLDSQKMWFTPFMNALRLGSCSEERDHTLTASTRYLHALQSAHSDKVHIYPQNTIPCQPIIIIDNTVIFGQYAHSDTHASKGFWGVVEADVDKLFGWASGNGLPENATGDETATYRLISDCHHAMIGGTS